MCICCDIILKNCSVTTCISLQSWINFLPGPPSFDDGRVAPFKSSASHAKDSQWGLGLDQCVDSVVFNPCVKSMSHAPRTTLHLSPINPGIGILEYIHAITVGKKSSFMETPGYSVYSVISGCYENVVAMIWALQVVGV